MPLAGLACPADLVEKDGRPAAADARLVSLLASDSSPPPPPDECRGAGVGGGGSPRDRSCLRRGAGLGERDLRPDRVAPAMAPAVAAVPRPASGGRLPWGHGRPRRELDLAGKPPSRARDPSRCASGEAADAAPAGQGEVTGSPGCGAGRRVPRPRRASGVARSQARAPAWRYGRSPGRRAPPGSASWTGGRRTPGRAASAGGGPGPGAARPRRATARREHGVVLARRGDGRVGVDWEATRRLRQRQMAGLAGPEGGPEPRGVEG